jgi:predicted aldo/keto reductase-like oxidoreductase
MNRRKFLTDSAKQIVILNAVGLTSAKGLASKAAPDNLTDQDKIQSRVLGKTGIKLPVVSMGVMNASNPNLVKAAWESGIRHFDTAWGYQNGNNEKMIGLVLHELKVKREDVTIATKISLSRAPDMNGRQRKQYFKDRLEESLSRLQMDFADILYLHAAAKPEQVNDPYLLEAFTDLKETKKIRFAGFSTHIDWVDLVADAARRKFYDVILLSFNYSMFQDERVFKTLQSASDAGIGLIAMKTQCRQDWYKKQLPADLQKYYEGDTMNSALLKWVLRHPYITTAVPGFTTYDQVEQDMAVAYDLNYSKEEEDFFRSKDVRLAIHSVCRHCGQCTGSCPQNVDIPSLMRTHMYAFSYGNPLMAKQTLSEIRTGHGLETCNNCDVCTARCTDSVRIAERISDLKELYC